MDEMWLAPSSHDRSGRLLFVGQQLGGQIEWKQLSLGAAIIRAGIMRCVSRILCYSQNRSWRSYSSSWVSLTSLLQLSSVEVLRLISTRVGSASGSAFHDSCWSLSNKDAQAAPWLIAAIPLHCLASRKIARPRQSRHARCQTSGRHRGTHLRRVACSSVTMRVVNSSRSWDPRPWSRSRRRLPDVNGHCRCQEPRCHPLFQPSNRCRYRPKPLEYDCLQRGTLAPVLNGGEVARSS
mmetsp:Transcript_90782/g.228304  ORF Transcript_90782/g.228304 Transcript_90782/m.228304 type:complete len:237 (+) Transcript_90782:1022-1732(+)